MGNSKFIRLLLCTLTLIVFFGASQGFPNDDPFRIDPDFCKKYPDAGCLPQRSFNFGTGSSAYTWPPQSLIQVDQAQSAAVANNDQRAIMNNSEQELQAARAMSAQTGQPATSAIDLCKNSLDAARQSCDPDQDGNMINATRNATQMASGISQMSGAAAACGGLGQALVTAQGALAGFQANCGMKQSRCQSACEQFSISKRECVYYKNVQAQAAQNIMGAYQMLQSVKACGNKLGSSLAQMCAQNPALPVCAAATGPLSCNDPQVAATNVTCICQNNPADPRCGSVDSSSQWSSTGVGSDGSKGPTGDPFGNGLGDLMGAEEMQMGTPAEGGDNQMAKGNLGGGGGASLGGGGTGGGAAAGGTGRGGSGMSADVLKGSYGGRGGGSAGGGRYGSNSEGNPGYGTGTGDPSIDLNKFLPGGKMDPSRGLAGVSGPDGITGPNSNIWKKIRTRYFSVSSSMRP